MKHRGLNVLAWSITLSVLAAVVAGIVSLGTPGQERLTFLDARRVDDLRTIAAGIDVYFERYDRLPGQLSELEAERDLFARPGGSPRAVTLRLTDPVSSEPYVYETLGERSYRLCAVFAAPSPEWEPRSFWRHEAGSHCYELSPRPPAAR